MQTAERVTTASLYQYAVIWHPTEAQAEDGGKSRIVVDLTTILAPSKETAALLAARAIPEVEMNDVNQLEVILRPF